MPAASPQRMSCRKPGESRAFRPCPDTRDRQPDQAEQVSSVQCTPCNTAGANQQPGVEQQQHRGLQQMQARQQRRRQPRQSSLASSQEKGIPAMDRSLARDTVVVPTANLKRQQRRNKALGKDGG